MTHCLERHTTTEAQLWLTYLSLLVSSVQQTFCLCIHLFTRESISTPSARFSHLQRRHASSSTNLLSCVGLARSVRLKPLLDLGTNNAVHIESHGARDKFMFLFISKVVLLLLSL